MEQDRLRKLAGILTEAQLASSIPAAGNEAARNIAHAMLAHWEGAFEDYDIWDGYDDDEPAFAFFDDNKEELKTSISFMKLVLRHIEEQFRRDAS